MKKSTYMVFSPSNSNPEYDSVHQAIDAAKALARKTPHVWFCVMKIHYTVVAYQGPMVLNESYRDDHCPECK